MMPHLYFQIPEACLSKVQISHQIPPGTRYRLAYANCTYWQHAQFDILEQCCQTASIFIHLVEIRSKTTFQFPFLVNEPFLCWFYQLEEAFTLQVLGNTKSQSLAIKRNNFRIIYFPSHTQNSISISNKHYLFCYFTIKKDLILRFQNSSLQPLSHLLEKLQYQTSSFASTTSFLIESQSLHYLHTLLTIRKRDALELEEKISSLVIKLVVLSRKFLQRSLEHTQSELPKLKAIRQTIGELLESGQPFTIAELSETFQFSPRYLRRTHQRLYQESLQEFITRSKLQMAYKMIVEEGKSPLEVTYALNYYDSSAFNRAFKKAYGIAPSVLHLQMKEKR